MVKVVMVSVGDVDENILKTNVLRLARYVIDVKEKIISLVFAAKIRGRLILYVYGTRRMYILVINVNNNVNVVLNVK